MKLGTRGSTLAVTQSESVAARLRERGIDVDVVTVKTRGDRERGSLKQLSGLGIFAAELRSSLLRGEVDLAVHSLKDLPVEPVPGLVIAAVPERQSPMDALCSRDGLRLEELPAGARVGTGSPRRAAQIRRLRPDLVVVDIRGNVDTRLARLVPGDLDAVVLAASGLRRLGLEGRITQEIALLPAPGQGALAVECRADDEATLAALAPLDDPASRLATTEERAVLAALGGGCAAPIGAVGTPGGQLRAGVFAADGGKAIEVSMPLAPGVGLRVAAQLRASGAAQVTHLGATRASRLAEFHDDSDLWPKEVGCRVFLPRPAGRLARELAERGMDVTDCPVQHRHVLVDSPEEVARLRGEAAEWSVVTSVRTVETLHELGVRLPGRIAAVGRATAEALRAAGYDVDLVPRVENARGLLADFPPGPGRWSAVAGDGGATGAREDAATVAGVGGATVAGVGGATGAGEALSAGAGVGGATVAGEARSGAGDGLPDQTEGDRSAVGHAEQAGASQTGQASEAGIGHAGASEVAVGQADRAAVGQTTQIDQAGETSETSHGNQTSHPDLPGAGRVFLPCSALAQSTLAEGLRGLGWQVAVHHVYTMEPAEIPEQVAERWRAGRFAAVIVTSGSVARTIDAKLGWPAATRVLAIGQPTAEVLAQLGVAASVSPSPGAADIAAAVAELVGKGNT